MSIRFRLTLIFTGLIAFILLILELYIYYAKVVYSEEEFYTHLNERAFVVTAMFLRKDELSTEQYKSLEKKYRLILPDEIISIHNPQNVVKFIDTNARHYPSKELLTKIREKNLIKFREGERQTVGIAYNTSEGEYVVLVSAIDKYGMSKLIFLQQTLIFSFFGGIVLVFLAGFWYTKQAFSPLFSLTHQVSQINTSNLDTRVHQTRKKDEIANLTNNFNQMLARLEEGFASQKSFVNNASHELRTPLTAIIGEIEVSLSKERDLQEYQETLSSVLTEAERLKKLADNLLILAQTGWENAMNNREFISIKDFLKEIINEVKVEYPRTNIQFKWEEEAQIDVLANRQLLQIAFKNLIENACKYSREGEVQVVANQINKYCRVDIIDNGIGIETEELDRVFQPFYRGFNTRAFSGSGIGLYLVKKILTLHQAEITIDSKINEGTKVMIDLPVYEPDFEPVKV